MKQEKQQRFSIRKYAVGAASVLIGFAFQAQAVAADGVTPTTENQPTIHTVSDSPQASENRTEETPKTELQPEAPKTVEAETPSTDKVASLSKTGEKSQEEEGFTPSDKEKVLTSATAEKEISDKKSEEVTPKKEELEEADSKESNIDKTDQPEADKDKPSEKDNTKTKTDKLKTEAGKERSATQNEK